MDAVKVRMDMVKIMRFISELEESIKHETGDSYKVSLVEEGFNVSRFNDRELTGFYFDLNMHPQFFCKNTVSHADFLNLFSRESNVSALRAEDHFQCEDFCDDTRPEFEAVLKELFECLALHGLLQDE